MWARSVEDDKRQNGLARPLLIAVHQQDTDLRHKDTECENDIHLEDLMDSERRPELLLYVALLGDQE